MQTNTSTTNYIALGICYTYACPAIQSMQHYPHCNTDNTPPKVNLRFLAKKRCFAYCVVQFCGTGSCTGVHPVHVYTYIAVADCPFHLVGAPPPTLMLHFATKREPGPGSFTDVKTTTKRLRRKTTTTLTTTHAGQYNLYKTESDHVTVPGGNSQ